MQKQRIRERRDGNGVGHFFPEYQLHNGKWEAYYELFGYSSMKVHKTTLEDAKWFLKSLLSEVIIHDYP